MNHTTHPMVMEQRTSREWWEATSANPALLMRWLRKQFQGERTAAERIERYCMACLPARDRRRRVLDVIATQERTHAAWVGELLRARGDEPGAFEKDERYWKRVLAGMHSFEDAAGAAHHAEAMRLERIEAIASDLTAPSDIRAVFGRILRDERFHARAFARLAGAAAIERTRGAHQAGAAAIGFLSQKDA